jgi:hypothetical protein
MNRPLVTDELVEFEKELIEIQDFRKIIDHFRGIYGLYLNLMKEKPVGLVNTRIFFYQLFPQIFPNTDGKRAKVIHKCYVRYIYCKYLY